MKSVGFALACVVLSAGLLGPACTSEETTPGEGPTSSSTGTGGAGGTGGQGGAGATGGSSSAGDTSGGGGGTGGTGAAGGSSVTSGGDATGGGGGTGGQGGTGGHEPRKRYCAKGCETAADCCPAGTPNCPGGAYPDNWTCEAGICVSPQCSSAADCALTGAPADYECLPVGGQRACVKPCKVGNDCGAADAECTGRTTNGRNFCQFPFSCSGDAECNGFGICVDGDCVCDSDDDCTDPSVDKCPM
ncbi:hypothetical protein [Sorangium sp. So ce1000]|uniref:hypothetical protein n=1 Tax=Sorangium sp. So ce1000 TaxID=3133325 RepID=UPI003F638828